MSDNINPSDITSHPAESCALAVAIPDLVLPTRVASDASNDIVALEHDLSASVNNGAAVLFVAEKLLALYNSLAMDATERRAATDALALQCLGQFHCQIEQMSLAQQEQQIGNLVRLTDELITAYTLAYAALGDTPSKIADPFAHAQHTVFRTLELIRAKQVLLAQANRALRPRDWQIANSMMFNQLQLRATNAPATATVLTRIHADENAAADGFERCSIDFLYRAIQLTGVVKAEGLSPAQLLFIDQLLLGDAHFFAATPLANTDEPLHGYLVTAADAGRPAHPPFTIQDAPGLLLQTSALREALELQRRRLDARLHTAEAPGWLDGLLNHLAASQRQPTLYRILEAVTPRSRSHERAAADDATTLNAVFGFTSIYRLATNHRQPSARTLYELIVREQLAGSGSRMASDETYQPSQWDVIDTSVGGLMVSAPINRFGIPLQPDDLIAFISRPTDATLEIGYIARMVLEKDDRLCVGVCRLAQSLEAIRLRAVEDQHSAGSYPALLLRALDNRPLLLVEHLEHLHTGDPAFIVRAEQQIPARLGKVVHAKARFMLFEISSPLLERPEKG